MARKVVYDSSNEAQVRAAEKDGEDREKDLAFLLKEPRGRRWLYDLIHDKAHLRGLSFVPGDTHATAFNEGARSVGEAVLEEIRTRHFGAFKQMMEENHGPE